MSAKEYIEGVLSGDRIRLARAITVIESELESDRRLAAEILDGVLPHTGRSQRTGITGVPGCGKSTFIDALGMHLVKDRAEMTAVLTVDPSSPVSGGSILGDKTRMRRLAAEPGAFIRPSASRGHLGGVARHTRETILLCEAAGYRNILVETVGVGQSETAVRSVTDFFLLLMAPGAGDELQGIKRGIIEMLDGMAINKADGEFRAAAERARAEYSAALRLFPASAGWRPKVLTCSALNGEGIAAVWETVLEHRAIQEHSGARERRRQRQAVEWMQELVSDGLQRQFRDKVRDCLPSLEQAVAEGRITAVSAARDVMASFRRG